MKENPQKMGGILPRWGKRIGRWTLCLLICCSSMYVSMAQNAPAVSLNCKGETLVKVIEELRKQTRYNFLFNSDELSHVNSVSVNLKNVSLQEALKVLLNDKGLTYSIEKETVVIRKSQQAKTNLIQVKGKVTDEKGNALPGATVQLYGTTIGVSTDVNGHYMINAQADAVLRVSFIGYKSETVSIEGRKTINLSLKPEVESLEEVTVVAFGTQKKESVVSAIETVTPGSLKSSSSDLTTQFAGKIAGIVGWQTGGLPGALTEEEMNTKFYIRGITSFQTEANIDPLILIDNVESSKLDLSRIAPEDIESFSVLKDASATAMYGARGANGVILISTKKGEEGNVYTSVRYEAIVSMPTREIEVVDPVNYMRMYNQALLARNPQAMPQYSVERIERTGSKNYPSWVYPANDWYKTLFQDYSINHHMGLNIRGGSNRMQYYGSLNWNRDEGMLKTDRLNQFDCNINNNTFVFRTNMNIDLNTSIRLLINTSASLDKYHGPLTDVSEAYYMAFSASPVDFAPTYPGDETYGWPHIRFGALTPDSNNPYKSLHEGYLERERFSLTARAEYIHNLSSLLKGLELRASIALYRQGYSAVAYSTAPFLYKLANYDFETGEHELGLVKEGRRTVERDGGSDKNAESQSTRINYEIRGLHTAAWKDHQTSLTAVLSMQESTTSTVRTILDGIPQRNMSLSMRATYGYKDRYFVEGSFGYNGSERFDRGHRWGFFPALGGAWIISKERFLEDHTSQWLSFLKLRASWGKVGNDGIIASPRYVFLPQITTYWEKDPRPSQTQVAMYSVESYPNSKIKWEVAEQVNLGLETKFFNGLLETNIDFYQEVRHNILDYRRTVPATLGLTSYQLANVGKVRARGIDLSAKVQHAFSPDFWVILNGTFTYNKAVFLEIEEAEDKPAYQRKKGQEISQAVGYIAEGLFGSQAEIDYSPVQGGDVMPGDIRYRDLNDDGVVDVNDATYIGFPETPRTIYGFSGFVNYRNWEFSFAFQGSGKRSFFVDPMKINPFVGGQAMLKAIYDDHWSENYMKERPFWPRLSTQSISVHNPQEYWDNNVEPRKSTYFMRECRFLRCTSIELGYNLPKKIREKIRMQNVKFYARVNNPFLISNFKIWDVELGDNGFNYPIQRTYSVGVNISF